MQIVSQCSRCKHFNSIIIERNVCKAFPTGIPKMVFFNEKDHRKKIKNDNGIQFEPTKPKSK